MFIHIMVKRENSEYVAHALEFDLMSAGSTLEDAIRMVKDNIATYIEACQDMGVPASDMLRKAPQEFYDEYERVFRDDDSVFVVGRLDLGDLNPQPRQEAAVGI